MSQQTPGYQQPDPQQPYQQGPGQQFPGYQGPQFQPPQKPKKSIWKRWWMICLYIIVAIAVFANMGGGGSDDAASSDTTTAADSGDAATTAAKPAAKAAPKKAEAKKAGIGTAVKSDDLTLTVTEFKCGVSVSDGYQDITPQGQFCKMSVTIKNDGSDQATVDDSQIKVKDAKGNEYGTSSDTMTVDGNIFLKQINPGNKITGVAYFDVPAGTKPVTAEFRGSILSSPAVVSLS
ncbi:DUF4352 domain-containing protein [Acidipropionibacterium acidipropionici]|uniref:DUF4352 domain-containing protein n=1 Tax=Acidipropionibacterium acidipropionici TaxID=1748 RepID=A0AAC8YH20_9ACTN|nr:DUF4352 domain-containing protein [Acidipropionibacterium acidipropionici]AMS06319.1 hypothetical protein AXH35_13585 [Acidipropionibacterium acidipropionici]AOZ47773.1 hypothetical protein A8L58_15035 [Acidipropionibacterium acidipropionici]AZP38887.1 DUF4352 domain-containing protein [Acidipropionibacterium acidipropionici]